MHITKIWIIAAILSGATQLTGCALVAVADAAVTVTATVVKVGAKTVGAVADAIIPDSDKKKESK